MKRKKTTKENAAQEYARRLRSHDFRYPEILVNKTVADVLMMSDFVEIMTDCINEQKEARMTVLSLVEKAKEQGKKVAENRPTIDRVLELGLLDDTGKFVVEFAKVLNKQSEHKAAIREYIRQLGMLAYGRTIEKIICDANPDLRKLKELAATENGN